MAHIPCGECGNDGRHVLGDGAASYQNGALPGGKCTQTKNVFQDWWDWSAVSPTVNTVENIFNDNWYNAGKGVDARGQAGSHSCDDANESVCVNTCTGNIQICGATPPASCPAGTKWPAEAQAIIDASGLEAAYADLKTNP